MAGRHGRRLWPQYHRHPAAADGDARGLRPLPAATCAALGGTTLAPTSCLVNSKAASLADLRTFGKAGTYQTAYGTDIRFYGLSLSKNIAGVSVGAELSYRENMPLVSDAVTVLPAPLAGNVAGAIATTAIPARNDTPGARGNTWHGLVNGTYVLPQHAIVRHRIHRRRADLDVPCQGHPERRRVQGVRQLYRDRQAQQGIRGPGDQLHAHLVSSAHRGGSEPAHFLEPGHQRQRGHLVRWQQGHGHLERRPRRHGLPDLRCEPFVHPLLRRLLEPRPAGAAAVFNGSSAAISDRGWVSLTFKTTF
ncbi:MAG: DUF1302 family protein [Ideonella sp.]|nr:DUF1302 family protein [Ideonella sp.]